MKTLEQLRAELTKALGALDAFENGIKTEAGDPRDMTETEFEQHNKLLASVEAKAKEIEAREKSDKVRAQFAAPADGASGTVPAQPRAEPEQFKTFGEFLSAVAVDGMNKGHEGSRDRRLIWQKVAGANEAVPSEGGFLVQTDHSTALLNQMNEMGEILRRVRSIPISAGANGIKLPAIDETSRATGSRFGGVRTFWADEGDTVTATKPKLRAIELKLNKLMGIGYITEELLADAAAMEAIMQQAFAEELTFATEDAFVNGTGSGQPLGFMNSGAKVTVSPTSGQAAATISALNILQMWDRLPVRSRRNAVWLVADSQVETQLQQMVLGSGTAVTQLYKVPGTNGATPANAVYGTLLGAPVIPVEYMAQLGTVGDIALVDLSQYLKIDKGGMKQSQSMHVRFLYDEMTFKVTYRVDGQPALHSPITPANGSSATKSPFVLLGSR